MKYGLGRRTPTDWRHVERFPLSAEMAEALPPTPIVMGINWYVEFDRPVQDSQRHWWVARDGRLTTIRGGHCVPLRERGNSDPVSWWDFYNQGSEGACFPAGTLIEMADGSHKPIEDVRPLQRVRTAEGRESLVLASMARFHADGLVTLKLRGHRHLKATAEHPILTRRGYVPLAELRIGDEVRLPGVLSEMATSITTRTWLAERELRITTTGVRWMGVQGRPGATATVTDVPEQITLTPAFGRIIGLWLAEGGTTANTVRWYFGGHERDTLVADLVGLLRSELGCDPRVQKRGNGHLNVIVYGKHWRMLFERMLSLGPYDKTLPAELASGPRDFLHAVLCGWLDGDGHKRRHTLHGVTVSHRLALAMYRIAQALGLAPTLRTHPGKPNAAAATRRARWDLEFTDSARAQASVEPDGVWRKVVGLEHEYWAGFVFNLEVEGDHSYVAEGVGVHNCVGFGCSRVMSLMNRKRYFARWLWDWAKETDEWTDTNPGDNGGTSVRAALDILRLRGHVAYKSRYDVVNRDGHGEDAVSRDQLQGSLAEGVAAFRWVTSMDDLMSVLGHPGRDYVEFINSWGRGYPHFVRFPLKVVERLWREDGELGVVTDR